MSAVSPFVTSSSTVTRPFYVVVDQIFLSNDASSLDLNDGDIFIVTRYNKVGYWWGVSVYDLDRQGWFPSTFVQPYTGQVPQEASEFVQRIRSNKPHSDSLPVQEVRNSSSETVEKEYNIVTEDVYPFQEYGPTVAIAKRGREVAVADSKSATTEPILSEDSDIEFDYATWADQKNEKRTKKS